MKGDEIVAYFSLHPDTAITIHQLAAHIDKSYAWTYQHTLALTKEGTLTMQRVGAALLCRLRVADERTIGRLCLASGVRAQVFLAAHPTYAEDLRKMQGHLGGVLTLIHHDGKLHIITHNSGTHIVAGHELITHTPTKFTLDLLKNGTILLGYEHFWRIWGELNG